MRDFITLIGALKCIIPKDNVDLPARLDSIVSSLSYAPPELATLHGERILEAYLPYCSPPQEEWQIISSAIISDVHVDEIRKFLLEPAQS